MCLKKRMIQSKYHFLEFSDHKYFYANIDVNYFLMESSLKKKKRFDELMRPVSTKKTEFE